MIDRKYNRTADTGRFELIHKGAPVPIPIYVGIDLRVEGNNRQVNKLFCFYLILSSKTFRQKLQNWPIIKQYSHKYSRNTK